MTKMLATAAGLALAAGALANPALSLAPGGNLNNVGARAATNAIVNFDVTGIDSWDAPGSPNNVIVDLDLAAALGYASGTSITMTSVGWDVTLTSFGASWLSEIGVAFGDQFGPAQINLRPGAGSNAPGTSTPFSSGGQVQFDSIPLPDIILSNGVLRMEFFESFDDVAGAVDGIWESGVLSIGTFEPVVPTPGAAAVLGLAGLAGLRRRR
jgi:hypothetical protein